MTHHLGKNEMYRINKGGKSQSVSIFKKPQVCMGFSSRTKDGFHILLLDYDDVEKYVVLEDIKRLQTEQGLPPAYLFTTGVSTENGEEVGNFHVVFLSKVFASEAYELMKQTHIDANFHDSPIRTKYKSWVLRMGSKVGSKKPKFLRIIDYAPQPISDFPISTAHKNLLSKLYPKIKHPDYAKLEDGLNDIRIQQYETK